MNFFVANSQTFNFFSVLELLGGIGLFLFGMTLMAQGLQKLAGGKMQLILEKLTNNRFKGLLLGAGVTAIIQSSTATTVMVVGFVNAGIMQLSQVVGIIIGANVGTTLTAWMLSLVELEGDNFFLLMLKPANFSWVFAIVGAVLIMFIKKGKKPTIGQILVGLAVLFIGMGFMTDATRPLRGNEAFAELILFFENPLLALLLGFLISGIIQSSSASIGILQALALSTVMPFAVVFPLILGMNVGTTLTTIISSIGANKNAKRTAFVHLYYNVICAVVGLIVIYSLQSIVSFGFWHDDVTPVTIATIQSVYNVMCAAVFIPFTSVLERLVMFTIKDKEGADSSDNIHTLTKMLDTRFLITPMVALEQSKNAIFVMANIAAKNVKLATGMIGKFSSDDSEFILENENKLNVLAEKISNYLVKIRNLPSREDKNVSKYLHSVRDFERIGDHAENIMAALAHMSENDIEFSEQSRAELDILTKAINDILALTTGVLTNHNLRDAESIEPLEEVVDFLRDNFKERQIARLKENKCTVEAGVVYNDIFTDLERIADHCSNVGLYIIEEIYEKDGMKFELQEYSRKVRESKEFTAQYNSHREKYLGMLN
jgi:phosphate:Na+ symporter